MAKNQALSMGVSGSQYQEYNLGNTGNMNAYGPGTGNGAGMSAGGSNGAGGAQIFDTLTPQQHQIANMLQGNIQQGASQYQGQQTQSLNNALSANPAAGLSPQATEKYINKSVATPLLRQYDQTILPRLNDSYAAVGALMGSRRSFANAQALQGVQDQIGSHLANAQQQNMQLNAQMQNATADRQASISQGLQGNQLGYNRLGAELTGQPWMAIQPGGSGGSGGGYSQQQNFGQSGGTGFGTPSWFTQNGQTGTGAYAGGGMSNATSVPFGMQRSSEPSFFDQLLGGNIPGGTQQQLGNLTGDLFNGMPSNGSFSGDANNPLAGQYSPFYDPAYDQAPVDLWNDIFGGF